MFGTKTFTASLLLAAATLSAAATPEYFPLQQGNSWAFRSTSRLGPGTQTIEVLGKETIQNREYTKVGVFGRTAHLRQVENALLVWDTEASQEKTWLDFNAEIGRTVPVSIDRCTSAARIASKSERVRTPAGEWENGIQFVFELSCADAGLSVMYFVPEVGPVIYETSSIAGPVRWELVYTRAGSTAAEASQIGFTVALDSPSYQAAEVVNLQVRLTLRNTSSKPVTLLFPSSQRYDLRVWNERNQIVYTWSADKLFAQVIGQDIVAGERTFTFTANVPNLPPGRYAAEAFLATAAREYVGVVGFEVVR
jgi:hypothetical protein